MKRSRFLISSLALAGFSHGSPGQPAITTATNSGADDPNRQNLFQVFRQDHLFTLAGHRSHSSHSSHSSHRSSSGGGYYSPAPIYTPPVYTPRTYTAPSPAPTPPRSASPSTLYSPKPLSGRTELFTTIVRRVQMGLQSYGYYDGTIDGVVGPGTRAALEKFQGDYALKVTGTITPQVLDAFKIVAE